jgi:ADP-heptose:LPS heptosyltransferase
MRLETKIAIDRWFGTAAIRSLLLLGRLSGRKRSQDAIQPQTIFVLKLLGLGSIIQATPLLTAMLDLHPDAKIVFVTKRGNEALTNRLPGVSATLTMRDDGPFSLLTSLFRIVRACRTTRDACFINLEAHSKIGPLLTMLSGARWKAGFFRNPRDLAMAPAFDRLVYFNQSSPVAEVYLQLGRALGIDAISPPL